MTVDIVEEEQVGPRGSLSQAKGRRIGHAIKGGIPVLRFASGAIR